MGRTKKQKAAASKDEPGPDDYIFLILFFPVGRSGAKMVRDDDPDDIRAAQRIGRWMHEAGLPIRKLFSHKSYDQVIVEVRKEVPEDVIDSKLGAYKWVDTIVNTSSIPQDYRDCETTILRARVRSHDALEKISGIVYYPIERIIPTGPRSESQFRYPFPKPKRVGYAVPTTSTLVGYHPLPPEFTVVEEDNARPDVKPDIMSNTEVDVKPIIDQGASQAANNNAELQAETKPRLEADIKPKIEERCKQLGAQVSTINYQLALRPNIDTNPVKGGGTELKTEPMIYPNFDMNPSVEERIKRESVTKHEEPIVPNFDMNPSFEERIKRERLVKREEPVIPNLDMNPSTEGRLDREGFRMKYEEPSETIGTRGDRTERLNEPSPAIETNVTSARPPDTSIRKLESSSIVKTEPREQPAAQKRHVEATEILERGGG
ncbi:hypothetical protein RHS04_08644 [Rhizoctonia solani]|uniref:Uncharacterized protein n=1 Tax=Rhizoctonia solani TaxID=456999 RepID=A0A8H7H2N6_9AGAM|nr:hypothetical protein RHS04_08644 [Rhizoctonia solani]